MAKNTWKTTHSISTSSKKKNGKWKTHFHGNILKEKGKAYSIIILDDMPKPDKDGKIRLRVFKNK